VVVVFCFLEAGAATGDFELEAGGNFFLAINVESDIHSGQTNSLTLHSC
jgi:hypothetical protein